MDNPVRAMTILAAVTALALGGCATAPEATTGGRGAPSLVAAPEHLIRDAAAYDTFMHGAISISPFFTGPGAVAQAVVRARAYNPGALVRGAVAYGAIAALQDRLFVGALHDSGRTPQQRRQLITAIQANPAVLYRLAGARSAAPAAGSACSACRPERSSSRAAPSAWCCPARAPQRPPR